MSTVSDDSKHFESRRLAAEIVRRRRIDRGREMQEKPAVNEKDNNANFKNNNQLYGISMKMAKKLPY